MSHNKKNGSIMLSLNQLVDLFYVSRFNRDNLHSLEDGEDIDDSRKHRIYNKSSVKELMALFVDFFEWVINAKNISKVRITNDITLIRESTLPKIRRANAFEEKAIKNGSKAGEYYITHGKYIWRLWIDGETYKKMSELRINDPEFIAEIEKLTPVMEEKNKDVRAKNKSKST